MTTVTVAPPTYFRQDQRVRPAHAVVYSLTAYPEVVQVRTIDSAIAERNRVRDDRVEAVNAGLAATDAHDWLASGSEAFRAESDIAATKPEGTRDVIGGWTPASRRRMQRALGSVRIEGRWAMLTLTLPGEWYRTGDGRWRTPEVAKDELDAWRKRMERRFGQFEGAWKQETQTRGAPHWHIGVHLRDVRVTARTAAGVKVLQQRIDRAFVEFARSAWHSVITGCDGGCAHAHAVQGLHADLEYAERVRKNGRSSLSSYFSKHGVWRSKEAQHRTPGSVIRDGLRVVRAMIPGEPVRYRPAASGSGVLIEVVPDAVADWEAFADAWERPGRWWGLWRLAPVEVAKVADLRSLTEGDPEVAQRIATRLRLLARKVARRRSQRVVPLLVEQASGESRYDSMVVSRTLRSLHGRADFGWWLAARDGGELLAWMVEQAARCCWLDGVELARWLAALELPSTEPARLRVAVAARCGVGRT